jgi:hypothetical protein
METRIRCFVRRSTAFVCALALISTGAPLAAQTQGQTSAPAQQAPRIPEDQLDSLVAPIALYPDPLLGQVLVASTYPLEIVQLQQWLNQHKDLKGQALTDAVMKENWDPSIQAMAALPDVVKQMADNIKWTSDLGNAFLAQQSDVMDAVQRMRMKAKNAGNLKTTPQQKVQTEVVENKTVVVIQPASPEVVYVPSYNPTVVYGPPVYPYPAIYYPPPGYYAAGMAISFGVGFAIGAAWGGGWGWGCGWGGHNNIYINNNNTFIHNDNIINNRPVNNLKGTSNWQHNAQHRGAAPYADRATANKYGGTARGASFSERQAAARQNLGQPGARQQPTQRPGQGQARQQPTQRPGMERGGVPSTREAAASRPAGGDRVGNRQISQGSRGGAFGGASSGMSGNAARMSSSRGMGSMGAPRGGGRRR